MVAEEEEARPRAPSSSCTSMPLASSVSAAEPGQRQQSHRQARMRRPPTRRPEARGCLCVCVCVCVCPLSFAVSPPSLSFASHRGIAHLTFPPAISAAPSCTYRPHGLVIAPQALPGPQESTQQPFTLRDLQFIVKFSQARTPGPRD